ncbi:MAG: phosphoribosyltransferase [Candidatus Levybacteria bacterium]|nr:phosphoribosyltransferase [Candidatus Levybacteria bacterium]
MFKNRVEAGRLLSEKLRPFRNKKNTIVTGITRGGAILARELSLELNLPLDVIVIKKIGALNNPELAVGAVGPKKTVYWDDELCIRLQVSKQEKTRSLKSKNQERINLERYLRRGKRARSLKNKTVILTDDGIATGSTVLCAQKFFRKQKVKRLILATPVIAKDTLSNISKYFDDVIILDTPGEFYAIGQFYNDFTQVSNEDVVKILKSK